MFYIIVMIFSAFARHKYWGVAQYLYMLFLYIDHYVIAKV